MCATPYFMTSAMTTTSMLECMGRAVNNCSIVKHLTTDINKEYLNV